MRTRKTFRERGGEYPGNTLPQYGITNFIKCHGLKGLFRGDHSQAAEAVVSAFHLGVFGEKAGAFLHGTVETMHSGNSSALAIRLTRLPSESNRGVRKNWL